jgi:hypothetical protein
VFNHEEIEVFPKDKKINQEKIKVFPTNRSLAMKRWKFCQEV